MMAIIQKGKRRREEENKDSAFRYRGWEVEPSAISRFEKRNKVNSSALAAIETSPLGTAHYSIISGTTTLS